MREVLEVLGPWAWYGLQVIELRQTEDFDPDVIVYGRARSAGQIFLYEQPAHAAAAMRDFMRFDVLLHEIGHHLVQHRVRKLGRVRRDAEHERFADMFAERWKPAVQAALTSAELRVPSAG